MCAVGTILTSYLVFIRNFRQYLFLLHLQISMQAAHSPFVLKGSVCSLCCSFSLFFNEEVPFFSLSLLFVINHTANI